MRPRHAAFFSSVALVASVVAVIALPSSAHAHEFYVGRVPNPVTAIGGAGIARPCINCHNNPDGGDGCIPTGGTAPCLNPFGMAFRTNLFTWNATLAMGDADGDGFTNGQELQDPLGAWRPGSPDPGIPAYHTRPGFSTDNPGLYDADHDGYCYFGYDADHSGTCSGATENTGPFDCDDAMSVVHTGATEDCTNLVDDDCNGFDTLHDPACVSVIDGDGDGWCPTGHDLNGDRNCLGAGEAGALVDCDDTRINVHPTARENCTDGYDNDCNGFIDLADSMCTGTDDVDGDGYCPIGEDLNGNGSCLDAGEQATGLADCDDSDPAISPSAAENCTDGLDNDCDGNADRMDSFCGAFLDLDADTFCPSGLDMNADGDCLDTGESTTDVDCNDGDPLIHVGALEDCLGSVDHDCDGLVGLADADCAGYLDADHDSYCFVGFDRNHDGDCADSMEIGGIATDCNDASAAIGPAITEVCTDGVDNDCDGSLDARDGTCATDYLDFDHDAWCGVGQDLTGDGDCDDAGEQAGPADADPHDPTVHPMAHENCVDMKDNDQDGLIDVGTGPTHDMADPDCWGTTAAQTDTDGDGYCPYGVDLNHDGDCMDAPDEMRTAISDCDDTMSMIGPMSHEITRTTCTDFVDEDCDFQLDLEDHDCWIFLDRDGDGYCPMGIDDSMNGQCLDEGEDRFGMDCDDANAAIGPRSIEDCSNGHDDDCDGRTDAYDTQCNCLATVGSCDDGDPCTVDTCDVADAGVGGDGGPASCVHLRATVCEDGGMSGDGAVHGDGGDGGTGGGGGGCCRVEGTHDHGGGALALAGVVALVVVARRRRYGRTGGGR